MVHHNRRKIIAGLASTSLVAAIGDKAFSRESKSRPNIIFILADDLGYADLGVYGQRLFKTPNIDKLASQGLMLKQAYSNSAVCSATRVALMTGRYQYRLEAGLEEPISPKEKIIGLPPDIMTLPLKLRQHGYSTALIGKWHLGYPPLYSPLKNGYDVFYGNHGGAIDYFSHQGFSPESDGIFDGSKPVNENGYYTKILETHAVNYLRKIKTKTPFFLSLHFTAPHWPWEGPDDSKVSPRLKSLFHYDGGSIEKYGKMVEALDTSVGAVLKTLDDQKLEKDTIVIFTSDNGGERFSDNWPFSGQKTELLEGGIRVPAIIRWPGTVKKNSISNQVSITMDWVPTLLAAAEIEIDKLQEYDGVNILNILKGRQPLLNRKLYWRYKGNNQRAHRSGDLKYLKIGDNEFLFNVVSDQRERANLKDLQQADFETLRSDWISWNNSMLPITEENHTHGVKSMYQADHYSPDK